MNVMLSTTQHDEPRPEQGVQATIPHRILWRPSAVLGTLLLGFLVLQCFLPLRTALKIGADEDFELSKATLCMNGYKLYTEIWDDQPPLDTFIITKILQHVSPSILGPRLLTVGFAMLLLTAVFILVLRINGLGAAAIATGLLIASPGFLELSASAMQEIPALAPAISSLCLLWVGRLNKRHFTEIGAGALLGFALQMKLIVVVYLPLAALALWLRYRVGNWSGVTKGRSILCFTTSLAVSFFLLNWMTGSPFLIQLDQAWNAHFAAARSSEYGSPNDRVYDWTVLLKNWDASLAALAGVVVLVRRLRQAPEGALPLAWLPFTLAAFALHKPWWAFYYIHNAIPLCWCAGIGFAAVWPSRAGPGRWVRATLIGGIALAALLWSGTRLYLEAASVRSAPKLYTSLVLRQIQRFKPFTKFLFTDQPIYSFHADIPMPPRLAMISFKRLWSGDISNAMVAADLEQIKPGLLLLANDSLELPFQALINREYRLVYRDQANRLYAHSSIARKPPL